MNDSQLRAFVEVAACGSFSKAAENLFLSKQALKKQIDALEAELGFSLMLRSSKGILLTPSGERFLQGSKALLNDFAALIDENRRAATEQSVIRIRTFDNPRVLLEGAFSEFSHRYPNVQQKILFQKDYNALESVLSGQVDVAQCVYSPEFEHKDLVFAPLYTQHYQCLMTASHPLAGKDLIEVEELENYRLGFFLRRNLPLRDLLRDRLPLFNPENVDEIPEYELQNIFSHCYSGHIYISRAFYTERMAYLVSIPLNTPFTFESGILYRKDASALVMEFVEIAKQTLPWGVSGR